MQALENRQSFVKPTFKYSASSVNRTAYDSRFDALPQSDIAELFFSVWYSHQMTWVNRQRLKSALLNADQLNESDYRLINRLLHAVKRGWVKMTD